MILPKTWKFPQTVSRIVFFWFIADSIFTVVFSEKVDFDYLVVIAWIVTLLKCGQDDP